jgi:hypothetical protein
MNDEFGQVLQVVVSVYVGTLGGLMQDTET